MGYDWAAFFRVSELMRQAREDNDVSAATPDPDPGDVTTFEPDTSMWQFREERLQAAGFPDYAAWQLARNRDVDLHAACDLLERGCSVVLALQILS